MSGIEQSMSKLCLSSIFFLGYYPVCVSMLLKICDWNFLVELIARIAHTLPSFKAVQAANLAR
jgi:hypothetical protein